MAHFPRLTRITADAPGRAFAPVKAVLASICTLLFLAAAPRAFGQAQKQDSLAATGTGDSLPASGAKTLKSVIVAGKKPLIEHRPGMTIINVESSITAAGSSVFEILARSPGVSTDQNDNISLKGRQGVIIMIDGKLSPLSGTDLANQLRAMPANTIEKIELITNPGAKYEAAGSAGIINIRTKKNQLSGFNGTLNLSAGQGLYSKMSEGITLNYRHGALNIFGSYNYSYRKGFVNPLLYRRFFSGDTAVGAYRQRDNIIFPFHTQVARLGMDYNLSPHTVIGWVANGLKNSYTLKGDNSSDVLDPADRQVSTFRTTNRSDERWYNYALNASLRHHFDTSGTELDVDLDYARYWNNTVQDFTTNYFKPDGSPLSPSYILSGSLPGRLRIESLKAAYTRPLGHGVKIEMGFKTSYVHSDNDIAFFDESGGSPVLDTSKSNHFIYKENIQAAYFTWTLDHKKWNYELGVRAEQTRVRGDQLTTAEAFDSSYLQLFPHLTVKYTLSDKHEFSFAAGRRIDRPTYKQLNPFKFYIDPTTYTAGNPYLRPQETYNFELSHTFRQKLTTTVSYSVTRDNITEVLYPLESNGHVTVQGNKNLDKVRYYTLSFSLPLQVTRWWNTSTDLSLYYGHYKGSLANTDLDKGNLTWNLNSNNSLTMGKIWKGELNGFYRAGEVYGFYYIRPQWQVTAGVQRTILKNKGTIKLNVSDIFFSNYVRGTTTFTDYFESFTTRRETRIATISFSYRFGSRTIGAAPKRSGGAEQEKSRAATSNG